MTPFSEPNRPEEEPEQTPPTAQSLWEKIVQLAQDSDMEELLLACRDYLEADAAAQTDPDIRGLLMIAAEACEDASFNYYASFK